MEPSGTENAQNVQSRRYMSKSQRACDFCRERKSACRIEGGAPCQLCSYYKRQCTFSSSPVVRRKRALTNNENAASIAPPMRPSSAGTMLQNGDPVVSDMLNTPTPPPTEPPSFENAFQPYDAQSFPEMDEDVFVDDAQNGSHTVPQGHASQGTAFDPFADWFNSPNQLMNGMESFEVQEQLALQEGRYCGLTGDMDPYLLRLYRFNEQSVFPFKKLTVRSIDASHFPIQFLQTMGYETQTEPVSGEKKDHLRTELEAIVPTVVGGRLISLYHQFITPQLPLLPAGDSIDTKTSAPSLLAAVYYIAQNFAAFDDYLCIQTVYDPPPLDKLWNSVMQYVHRKDRQPSIDLLRAVLILVSSPPDDILKPDFEQRQSLLSDANTIAQALGLYYDATSWPVPAPERRLRKRLSWSLRFADSWNAAVSGRQSCISEDDWLVADLLPEDFSASEVQSGQGSLAIEMAKLTNILREVTKRLFSLKVVQSLSQDFLQTMRTAQPLMERLNDWQTQFSLQHNGTNDQLVDNSAPLQLASHYTRTLIIRAIYRPFCTFNIMFSSQASGSMASEIEAYAHYRVAAKTAANRFTEFAREINDRQIRAFWPFWCTGAWATMCNLWLLLHSTATSDTEREECRTGLADSRNLLRLRANSFPILQFALLRVNSIFWKGLENVIDESRS